MDCSRTLLTGLASLCVAAASASDADASAQCMLDAAGQVASRLTHSTEAAEELVSETTTRLLSRKPEVVTGYHEGWLPYLRRCVVNAHRDLLRRDQARGVRAESDLTTEHASLDRADRATHVAEDASVRDFRATLRADDQPVLDGLLESRSERELSEHLGRTRHQVRSAIGRIVEQAEETFGATALTHAGGAVD